MDVNAIVTTVAASISAVCTATGPLPALVDWLRRRRTEPGRGVLALFRALDERLVLGYGLLALATGLIAVALDRDAAHLVRPATVTVVGPAGLALLFGAAGATDRGRSQHRRCYAAAGLMAAVTSVAAVVLAQVVR